ncbi:MAG: DUF1738 domain-containing protein [Caulobacterales bacterium]|nr:DUF1738 domain-containing protein [Caulobacterales bacterium]
MTTSSTKRFDVHEAITTQIIQAIEAGTGPLQMPWHRSGGAIYRPTNIASGNAYRGVNVIALWAAAHSRGFEHGVWGTYRQWQAKGGQVRRGEKSSLVVFYKTLDADDDHHHQQQDDEQQHRRFVAKASYVFNVDQVDNVDTDVDAPKPDIDPVVRDQSAEAFLTATRAVIREGGDRAFYHPSDDTITMPDRWRFTGTETITPTEAWYATAFHELVHWSGAQKRLDRQFGERFGDDAYAVEEMVAEIGAAFLCGDLGITAEPRPDHAAYVDHWLRIMKGDRKAVFAAASAASKAADYLAGLAKPEEVRDAA